jgi:hypothetical protein
MKIHNELKEINDLSTKIEIKVLEAAKKLANRVIELFSGAPKVIGVLNMKATDRDSETLIILPESEKTFLEILLMKAIINSQYNRFSNKIILIKKELFKNNGLDIANAKGSEEAIESVCKFICTTTGNFITCGVMNWSAADNSDYIELWGNCSYDNKTLPVLELQD